ncbi:hypothetical protein LINPERHAP2_LOCUS41736 [Linum perenne]
MKKKMKKMRRLFFLVFFFAVFGREKKKSSSRGGGGGEGCFFVFCFPFFSFLSISLNRKRRWGSKYAILAVFYFYFIYCINFCN